MHMGLPQHQPVADYNSEHEENYYNIDEDTLNESQNMLTAREQVIKTFKPGGTQASSTSNNRVQPNHLPECPGFGKVELWRKNKASKGRVKVNPEKLIKKVEDLGYQYSDVGGDGGDQYLFDFEELKKAVNEATGGLSDPKEQKV